MWATNSSNLPLVSFLLSHGADLEARSLRGTTCEDFILSSSRETQAESEELSAFAGPSSRPSLGLDGGLGGPKSPHTSDRELIAETFYEYQQVVKERMKRSPLMRAHKHSASTSSLASSSWLPGSPSKVPSSLSMPHPPSPPEGSVNALSSLASPAGSRAHSRTASHGFAGGHSRTSSLATTTRRLLGRSERVQLAEQELRARELAEGRRRALLDTAVMLEVEYGCLVGNAPDVAPELGAPQPAASGRKGKAPSPVHSGLASGCGAVEVGTDPLSADFNWNQVRADQMLVIGMQDLAPLLDMLITNVKPVRAPWTARAAPANVIFLCARYACSFGDEELLEELILGAIDRIEGCIYVRSIRSQACIWRELTFSYVAD